jgi:hypothetical protein
MHFVEKNKLRKMIASSWLAAFIAPKSSSKQSWIEVFGFTLAALGFCWFIKPQDPLLIDSTFPWLWLVPMILALRYGSLAALGSSTLLLIFWALLFVAKLTPESLPGQYFLGGLTLSLLAGEFCDVWTGRLQRVRSVNFYLSQRLDSLTRRHYLLKISAEQMEQDLLAKPATLRDTLIVLQQLILASDAPKTEYFPEASELMRIIAHACQIQVASLYAEIDGKIQSTPSASIGSVTSLKLDDPMVTYALEHNTLCHIQVDTMHTVESCYLVVVPILATDGERLGILVVEALPFFALNFETLQILNVMLGYYADVVKTPEAVREIIQKVENCPLSFVTEMVRLDRVFRESGVVSILIALVFEKSEQQLEYFAEALRLRRKLDVTWSIPNSERPILITLMPLCGLNAANGYLERLEQQFYDLSGKKTLRDACIVPHILMIGTTPPATLLPKLLTECHAH